MEGPSYEDHSPSEGEEVSPAVLPLLSEQELRRVLEDLQGENSGLELWEGERELTGGVAANLIQPAADHQEEKVQAPQEEVAAKNLQKGELEDSFEEAEEEKSDTFGETSRRAEGPAPKEAKESELKRTMGRVVKFKEKVEVLAEDEVSHSREADDHAEAEASKFVKFREKREITTEEETTEEEEEEVRPSTSGMLLFSTLGGQTSRQQLLARGEDEDEDEDDGHTSGEGVGASSRVRGARQPARKRKRRARREPGDVLKRGDMLEYLVEDGDDETWFKVEVMGKGKAKGRNRNYINLKYRDGSVAGVFLDQHQWRFCRSEPDSFMFRKSREKFKDSS